MQEGGEALQGKYPHGPLPHHGVWYGVGGGRDVRSYCNTSTYRLLVKVHFSTTDLGYGLDHSTTVPDGGRSQSHQDFMSQAGL